ncbi:MAG: hypothetical protein ABEJ06_01840 [Haloarculaceae archaeon]
MNAQQTVESRTDDPEELTYDAIFFTLSNPRRRFVLHYLKRNPETISTGNLAAQVAAWENDIPVEQVNNQQRKRSYTSLHQTHLPKMDELGLLHYDASRGVVEPSERIEAVDFYLEIAPKNDIPWHEFYLGLSVVSLALVAALSLGVYPFTLVPTIGWAGVVTGVFLVSALVHVYQARTKRIGGSGLPPSLERPLE